MEKIKILHVHNYYKFNGGEDEVVKQERRILTNNDKIFELFTYDKGQNSDSSIGLFLKFILMSHFSFTTFFRALQLLRKHKIDIMHVHNTHFMMSPSLLFAAYLLNVKVLLTLHNYRYLHPSTTLYYKGEELSSVLRNGKVFYFGKYFHNSSILTFKLVFNNYVYRKVFELLNKNNCIRYACVSKIVKDIYEKDSLFNGRCLVHNNFIDIEIDLIGNVSSDTFKSNRPFLLYMGRLEPEKGVFRFLEHYLETLNGLGLNVIICGEGTEKTNLKEMESLRSNLIVRDYVTGIDKENLIKKCSAILVPSLWYETFGLTIIEGFAYGKPAFISEYVNANGIVAQGKTGFVINTKESLIDAVLLLNNKEKAEIICQNCIDTYKTDYSSKAKEENLLNLYLSFLK